MHLYHVPTSNPTSSPQSDSRRTGMVSMPALTTRKQRRRLIVSGEWMSRYLRMDDTVDGWIFSNVGVGGVVVLRDLGDFHSHELSAGRGCVVAIAPDHIRWAESFRSLHVASVPPSAVLREAGYP